jgi:hypothetical protein
MPKCVKTAGKMWQQEYDKSKGIVSRENNVYVMAKIEPIKAYPLNKGLRYDTVFFLIALLDQSKKGFIQHLRIAPGVKL